MRDNTRQTGSSIAVGNNVNTESEKNMPTGNVTFKNGTIVELQAPKIILDAGTTIEKGCVFSTISQ